MKYLFIIAGCSGGNFLFQQFAGQDWETAAERSFFQIIAVLCVAVADDLHRIRANN